jgi:hypothetical protein
LLFLTINGVCKMTNEHLLALMNNLSNERARLNNAKSDSEKALRKAWVNQLEKEVAGESAFLEKNNMTDDELLNELFS